MEPVPPPTPPDLTAAPRTYPGCTAGPCANRIQRLRAHPRRCQTGHCSGSRRAPVGLRERPQPHPGAERPRAELTYIGGSPLPRRAVTINRRIQGSHFNHTRSWHQSSCTHSSTRPRTWAGCSDLGDDVRRQKRCTCIKGLNRFRPVCVLGRASISKMVTPKGQFPNISEPGRSSQNHSYVGSTSTGTVSGPQLGPQHGACPRKMNQHVT